jgi:hypothetical protein
VLPRLLRSESSTSSRFDGTHCSDSRPKRKTDPELFCLHARGLDDSGPFIRFIGHELSEIGRRAAEWSVSLGVKPCLEVRIRKSSIYLRVELVDDVLRSAGRNTDAEPGTDLKTRYEFAQ